MEINQQTIDFNKIWDENKMNIVNYMLNGIQLRKEQLETIHNAITAPGMKAIIADEMGLGKTYTCMGLIQIARTLYPDKKIVITAPKNVLKNFEELIKSSIGITPIVVTGQQKDIENLELNFSKHQVILCQHSFWINSLNGLVFMYNNLEKFSMAFFDEADFKEADGFNAYLEFMRELPMGFLSNATPIGENSLLIYNLLYGCGAYNDSYRKFRRKYARQNYDNRNKLEETVLVSNILNSFDRYITVKNRESIGIEVKVNINFYRVLPSKEQMHWMMNYEMPKNLALYSPDTFNMESVPPEKRGPINFTPKTMPAAFKMAELLIKNPKKSIVYVRNTDAIKKTAVIVKNLGKNPYIIDGKHTPKDEDVRRVQDAYNADSNGVMITNIIKGTNLQTARRLIIYNNPSDVQQLIYRMVRGFTSKEVEVDWIYYLGYEEASIKKALEKTKNVSDLLDRNLDIIGQLERELKANERYRKGKKEEEKIKTSWVNSISSVRIQ